MKKTIALLILFVSSNISAEYKLETVIEKLDFPWEAVFISKEEILLTELPGKLKKINLKTKKIIEIENVPKVLFRGQGGLSGIVLHPNYSQNGWIYISYSKKVANDQNTLVVDRLRITNNSVTDIENVFSAKALRNPPVHYGAKMAFLDDNSLLITSGDGFDYREQAQDLDNHFGKIVRIKDNGQIPLDNPFFETENLKDIFSFGHRNMQGLVVLSDGRIIEHEHGPQGGDEINLIEAGKNYGWPVITYGIDYSGALITPFTEMKGMEQPLLHWTPSIAPSSMMIYKGTRFPNWTDSLFVSALVSRDVRKIKFLEDGNLDEEILFSELNSRIRNIFESPDGDIYLLTDKANAKIIKVNPI